MNCFNPLEGYRNEDGQITFNKDSGIGSSIYLPCGQCMECRLERSRQWAIRCMHEAGTFEENSFITLTYNEENLPENGTLVKEDLQNFWKRLRKAIDPIKIKYFACGEYGLENDRPHYHAIVFGYDFGYQEQKNRESLRKYGYEAPEYESDSIPRLETFDNSQYGKVYSSPWLESIWKKGFCTVAGVDFESCAYVARYVTKKINGQLAEEHYGGKIPEFGVMSRREAIGKKWIEEFHEEVANSNNIVYGHRTLKVPAYYDKWLEKHKPELFNEMKEKRQGHLHKVKHIDEKISRIKIRENQFNRLSKHDDRCKKGSDKDKRILKTLEGERYEIKNLQRKRRKN